MSALAHLIEARGVPTAVVGLIRLHMEKTRPPRGLWVPFPLGRPLGAVNDADFQRRVLHCALSLLERTDGPVILEDWTVDAPGQAPTPGWRPATVLPTPAAHLDRTAWSAALGREIDALLPHWRAARTARGRTTVGLTAAPPECWADALASAATGDLPNGLLDGVPPIHAFKFLCDDVRAFFQETATHVGGGDPAPVQLDDWFWTETTTAKAMIAARAALIARADPAILPVASNLLVPAPRVPRPA